MPLTMYPVNPLVTRGTAKGWWGFLWMVKIILPVSFITFLLEYSGWIGRLDGLLEPLMGAIHLPAMAALPLLAGLLTGIYGAIAAMSVLPLTVDQMTLIAAFLLIAHGLIQEGMVQHRSGLSAWSATWVRLVAAVVTVVVLGWVIGPETAQQTSGNTSAAGRPAFWPAMGGWAADMGWLSLKILSIITALMIFMEFLEQYQVVEKVVRLIEPVLGIMGLDRQVGMLWITAAVFGITYGGAVIVAETKKQRISPEYLKALHVSIGINHAMVEDPVLFLPLGIHPFWLWIPRLITAIIFTQLYRLWVWMKKRSCPDSAKPFPADGC